MRKSAGPMKLGSSDRLKRLAHECIAVADWVDNVEISSELIRMSFRILRMANTGVVPEPKGVLELAEDQRGERGTK
jgi:hypothetical protein